MSVLLTALIRRALTLKCACPIATPSIFNNALDARFTHQIALPSPGVNVHWTWEEVRAASAWRPLAGRPRARRLWLVSCRIVGRIALPRKREECLSDEVKGLALDLAMHVTTTAQAELLRDLGDGEALAGELQIGPHVVDAAV